MFLILASDGSSLSAHIVAHVFLTLIVLILLAVICYCYLKQRRRKAPATDSTPGNPGPVPLGHMNPNVGEESTQYQELQLPEHQYQHLTPRVYDNAEL